MENVLILGEQIWDCGGLRSQKTEAAAEESRDLEGETV